MLRVSSEAEVLEAPAQCWHAPSCAVFCRSRDPHGDLSNMSNGMGFEDPVTGLHWGSSEAWYQAQRFLLASDRELVRAAPNAYASKQVAYSIIGRTRLDWQQVKVGMMAKALRLKSQSPRFRRALIIETGDLNIVEKSSRDASWGATPDVCNPDVLVGQNMLGQLLMLLRDELK